MMTRFHLLPVAFAAALVFCCASAHAEVQKIMNLCDGKLCPFFKLVITPPRGWVIEKDATNKNKVQILVPEGKNFSNAEPLIYVKVSWHKDKQQSLAEFARISNEHWQASASDAKISELAPVERANGKPAFLRFAYETPSKTQQAFEIVSFGLDSDNDGNEFVLMVGMTGSSKAPLDRANKDYVSLLAAH
jgi:hypothetical protein